MIRRLGLCFFSIVCALFLSNAVTKAASSASLPTLSDWEKLTKDGAHDTLIKNTLRDIANGSLSDANGRLKLYLDSTIKQLSTIRDNLQKETDPNKKKEIEGYIKDAEVGYLMYSGQYPDALKAQYKKEWEAQQADKAKKDAETLKNLIVPDATTSWADLLKMYKKEFPSAKIPVKFTAGSKVYNSLQDALSQSAKDQKTTGSSLIERAQKDYKAAAILEPRRRALVAGVAFGYFMLAHALLGHADKEFLSANKLSYSDANGLKGG